MLSLPGVALDVGATARYDDAAPVPSPVSYLRLLMQRGRMEGSVVLDYMLRAAEAIPMLYGWYARGKAQIPGRHTAGVENAPAPGSRAHQHQVHEWRMAQNRWSPGGYLDTAP